MCVDLDYPHFRFANRFVAKDPTKGEINVEVVYPLLARPEWTEVTKFGGKQGVDAGSGWRMSRDADLKPDFAGKRARGALRRAALHRAAHPGNAGEWRVDDVWIDPRMRY